MTAPNNCRAEFLIEQFAYAVGEYMEAKREEEKAREEADTPSWGYFGQRYFERIDRAKENMTDTFKKAVIAIVWQAREAEIQAYKEALKEISGMSIQMFNSEAEALEAMHSAIHWERLYAKAQTLAIKTLRKFACDKPTPQDGDTHEAR